MNPYRCDLLAVLVLLRRPFGQFAFRRRAETGSIASLPLTDLTRTLGVFPRSSGDLILVPWLFHWSIINRERYQNAIHPPTSGL
jgi:hypothetical protein